MESLRIPDCCKSCLDVHCQDESHRLDCDDFLMTLMECVESIADMCLPSHGGNQNKNQKKAPLYSWNTAIQPFKDKAMFWHAIWVSAGRPLNTLMKKTRNVYHFQIRKCKKMKDIHKKNTFLRACLDNKNNDLFKAIRSLRRSAPTVATIDGRRKDIPDHFAGIYERLYNSVDDNRELMGLQQSLNKKINGSCMNEVTKVTSSVIVVAVAHTKQDKTDPIFNFSSDCFKNAPGILYDQLAAIFRGFLLHGHISSVLLLATLVPIVKDKLGNICSSDNYRSIANSSLILKIFDWVIILLYGDKLGLDELQFSYQPNISTNMCTWMAIETIDYFTRNCSDVYVCTMDMSKAFDKVSHSLLFKKLVSKGLPEIYSRLLIVMYREQSANVRWNVRSSAILFCVYLNDVYKLLRRRRSGCWVNGEFNGICGYSDDILLLAPCIDALQNMLSTYKKYAQEHNLQFSTNINPIKSKTKCIPFIKRKGLVLKEMVLCNNNIPWVNSFKHLGCVLTNSSNIMSDDVMFKQAVYVNRNNELCQEFYFTDPNLKIQINNLFNTSFWEVYFGTCLEQKCRDLRKRGMCHSERC